MNLSKFEKFIFQGAPWFFGVVLTVTGGLIANARPEELHGVILIGTGLICVSLYCVAALLVKLVQKS